MDNKGLSLLSLHKYWLQANRMMEDFIQEIGELPENTNIDNIYQYCSRINNTSIHTYRDLWVASIFIVIEGYKKLKLNDNKIDNLISENKKGISELREFRNSICHFEIPSQRNKKMKKLNNLSIKWLQELHFAFAEYLLTALTSIKQNAKENIHRSL